MEIIGIALWALIPGFIARGKGRNFWGYYFLSFLITPLITMIITLCLSQKTQSYYDGKSFDCITECKSCGYKDTHFYETCPRCGQYTTQKAIFDEKDFPDGEQVRFCRKCGAPLVVNSNFCRKCGTEVAKEQNYE